MPYQRKTRDRWDIESNYVYGWDIECSEYTRLEGLKTLREYRENLAGYNGCQIRMVKRREPIIPT